MAIETKTKTNGTFGFYYSIELGPLINTAADVLPKGLYVAKSFAAATGFPAATAEGESIGVNDVFYSAGAIALVDGDSCQLLEPVKSYSIGSWNMSISTETGDSTVFADFDNGNLTTQLKGLGTIDGTIGGINVVGDSDEKGGIYNNFFNIVELDGETSATKYTANGGSRLGLFAACRLTEYGDAAISMQFVVAPFQFTAASVGSDATSPDGSPLDMSFIVTSSDQLNTLMVTTQNVDALRTLARG